MTERTSEGEVCSLLFGTGMIGRSPSSDPARSSSLQGRPHSLSRQLIRVLKMKMGRILKLLNLPRRVKGRVKVHRQRARDRR